LRIVARDKCGEEPVEESKFFEGDWHLQDELADDRESDECD